MFDSSVSAHIVLTGDDLEMLREHLRADVSTRSASQWRLASTQELLTLQAWVEELALFGREASFRAADASIRVLEEIWQESSQRHADDEVLAAIAEGQISDPHQQIAAARHWLDNPSESAAVTADQTLQDMPLDEPDYDYMRERPYVWMLIAAVNLVVVTNHPEPAKFAGRAAVCAAVAAGIGRDDDGVEVVRARIRQALTEWIEKTSP